MTATTAGNRVLMISYWYPPTSGAGAQRAAGFARHLPGLGWQTTVLTACAPRIAFPLSLFAHAAAYDSDGAARIIRLPDAFPPADVFADYAGPPTPRRGRAWLRRWAVPDRYAVWMRRARRWARRSLSPSDFDVIWATFPPASAALLAVDLASWSGRPLVLDFRDNWIGAGGYFPQDEAMRARHEEWERRAVQSATAVVAISDSMRDDLARRFRLGSVSEALSPPGERVGVRGRSFDVGPASEAAPSPRPCPLKGEGVVRQDLAAERVVTIPNGFDRERCGPIELPPDSPRSSPPRLVHVGSVSQRNRPDLFLEALRGGRGAELGCVVRFVGNLSRSYCESLGLSGVVETTGLVSAADAWRETATADALLLLVGDYVAHWGHNTKVFEYLRANRPILCIEETPGSNDRRLLERLAPDRCVFAPLRDADAIARAIREVLLLGAARPFGALDDSAGLAAYDRGAQAAALSQLLRRVVAAD